MNWEITEYRIDFRYINIKKQGVDAHIYWNTPYIKSVCGKLFLSLR